MSLLGLYCDRVYPKNAHNRGVTVKQCFAWPGKPHVSGDTTGDMCLSQPPWYNFIMPSELDDTCQESGHLWIELCLLGSCGLGNGDFPICEKLS